MSVITDVSINLMVLGDEGFSWKSIARVIGTSVQTVQHLRHGGDYSEDTAFRINAFTDSVSKLRNEYGTDDVAAWYENRVLPQVPVTPLDMWVTDKSQLVFLLADDTTRACDVMDEYEPDWREKYYSEFETVLMSDGNTSIVRSDDG